MADGCREESWSSPDHKWRWQQDSRKMWGRWVLCCSTICDLVLLQKPDHRAWWYQDSPSSQIWGRDHYQMRHFTGRAAATPSISVIIRPTFAFVPGGGAKHKIPSVLQPALQWGACWDPWWWWDEEIWFKTSHKGRAWAWSRVLSSILWHGLWMSYFWLRQELKKC